jgi:hypothetical protein
MTEAECIVADLEKRRHEIMQRGMALDADRPRIRPSTPGNSLDAAAELLEKARQQEARSADREAAKQLLDRFTQFVEQGDALDAALAAIVETSAAMRADAV